MTLEMKIRRALDAYDDRMAELRKEYGKRFDRLPVNTYGETSARALLDLNAWSVQTENEIKREFIAAVHEAEGR